MRRHPVVSLNPLNRSTLGGKRRGADHGDNHNRRRVSRCEPGVEDRPGRPLRWGEGASLSGFGSDGLGDHGDALPERTFGDG